MSWYRDGTVTLTAGSTTVTGLGTLWASQVKDGSIFTTDFSTFYEVSGDPVTNTSLVLDRPYEGSSGSGVSYAIIRNFTSTTTAQLAASLALLLENWHGRENEMIDWLAGTVDGGPNGDGTYPLTDVQGTVQYIRCPAWITAIIGDPAITTAEEIIAGLQGTYDLVQPLQEEIQALAAIAADISTVAGVQAAVSTLAAISANITTVAGIAANVTSVADIAANVTAVAGIAADVTAVAGNATNIDTVAGDTAEINTLAPISGQITSVAAIGANVTTVAGVSTQVTTVAGIAADVFTVATNVTNVSAVAAIDAEVTAVAGVDTEVVTVAGISANVTTVAGISANVTLVATNSANINIVAADTIPINVLAPISADISAVSTISAAVSTVAGIDVQVDAVADIAAQVSTVAGISGNVTTVAGISGNVTTLAGISADVTTVAGISANVSTVAGISADVTVVAGNASDVSTVASISGDVTAVAGALADVAAAATNAAEAKDAVSATAFRFTFDSSTTVADPGTGDIRFNNATLSAVTVLAISALTADTGNPDVSSLVATWDDSGHTPRGVITFRVKGSPGAFVQFGVAGAITDNGTWLQVPVSYIGHSGALANDSTLFTGFVAAGNDGLGSGDLEAVNNLSDLDDVSAARVNLGLDIGVDVQAHSDKLDAFANLTWAANKMLVLSGINTLGTVTVTNAGLALLDDADVETQRTTLGLGYLATLSSINDTNWSGADLSIVNGGTGASTAAGARANLGSGTTGDALFTSETAADARSALGVGANWNTPIEIDSTDSPYSPVSGDVLQIDPTGGVDIDLVNAPTNVAIMFRVAAPDESNPVSIIPPTGKNVLMQANDDVIVITNHFKGLSLFKTAAGNYI